MTAAPRRQSLVSRALLAVALMVGFYALALAVAATLVALPFVEYHFFRRVESSLLFACFGAAATVILALVPRPDAFTAPGPVLDRRSDPALFTMVDEIATATRQPVPSRVFLLNDVNAWVSYRGGVMGVGSERVMGVGWPLLQMLSPIELKAVIAHEFGHYMSGDVSLGPWIYKTRATITRAIASARQSWLRALFSWYGRLFLRLTQSVSRQQEFVADEIAATTVGAEPLMRALRRVSVLAPAYSVYMENDVMPVLRAGHLPPLAAGFQAFVGAKGAAEWMHQIAVIEEQRSETDEYDSHPSLKDRLQALAALTSTPHEPPVDCQSLLAHGDDRATSALGFAFGADKLQTLQPITWQAVGLTIYAPSLRAMVRQYRGWYGTLTPADLDGDRHRYEALGSRLMVNATHEKLSAEAVQVATQLLTAAIAVALIDRGWTISAEPGRSFALTLNGEVFEPLPALRALVGGETSVEEWQSKCRALGIFSCRLSGGSA